MTIPAGSFGTHHDSLKDTDPGPVPGEESTTPGRGIRIALSEDVEEVLRAMSARTSMRKAVEESPQVRAAARQVLKTRYDKWVSELAGGEDIFGAKEG